MKQYHIYSISPNYSKVVIWTGSRMTLSRICITTITPKKGLSREERHAEISAALFRDFGIPGPTYRKAKGRGKSKTKQ